MSARGRGQGGGGGKDGRDGLVVCPAATTLAAKSTKREKKIKK